MHVYWNDQDMIFAASPLNFTPWERISERERSQAWRQSALEGHSAGASKAERLRSTGTIPTSDFRASEMVGLKPMSVSP